MKFALIRLLIGLPLLAIAVGCDGAYLLRCILGIIGAYIIGKLTGYGLHSLGMLLIGIPVYLITMAPNSFDLTSQYTQIDQDILQASFRLIGAFLVYIGFYNPDRT